MTDPSEPRRLVDPGSDASETLRAALRAGKSDLPDASQIARLAARLPLAPPPAGSPPPAAAAGAASGSVIASALTGAALAVAVVVGVGYRDRAAGPPARRAVVAAVASAAPAVVEASPPSASASAVAAVIASAAPSPAAAIAASITPSSTPSNAGIGGATGGSATSDGESEVHLLQRAQDALASDPSRALAIVGEHARRFPGGALSQEREVLAVAALVRVGRQGEARDRAIRFLDAHPRSAHRRRMEMLVGIDANQKNDRSAPLPP